MKNAMCGRSSNAHSSEHCLIAVNLTEIVEESFAARWLISREALDELVAEKGRGSLQPRWLFDSQS